MKGIGIRKRDVVITTLNNGLSGIFVEYSECHFCNAIVRYNGRNDVIFCLSEGGCVTKELLCTWLYDLCCVGNTFRDAF